MMMMMLRMMTCFPDSVCPALEVRRRGHDTGRGRLHIDDDDDNSDDADGDDEDGPDEG